MTTLNLISAPQLRTAQVLWSKYFAHHALDFAGDDARAARLKWTAEFLGHSVESFHDLTRYEAHRIINELKRSMNMPIGMRSRQRAADRGLQGRRIAGRPAQMEVVAGREDLDRLHSALSRLGWSQERFEKWLESPTSPVKGSQPKIRTQAEANRVWWALKRMLRRQGLWEGNADVIRKEAV